MRVLVVEDDKNSRDLLARLLTKEGYEVDIARNGMEAFEQIEKIKYQAVLTDWMMPQMDGIELTHKIRKLHGTETAIIMITALASKEAKERSIDAGADDYISKPINNRELIQRLSNCIKRQNIESAKDSEDESMLNTARPPFFGICIAAGTGGPQAITKLVSKFKMNEHTAVFIVCNGPAWMIDSFIVKLKQVTEMKIHLAYDGLQVRAGEIYVAPDDKHMIVDRDYLKIKIVDSPPENFVRPSADPLFKSMAATFGENCIAIVLTGMGNDGSIGSGYIKAADGFVIAQEPSTSLAPSMPKSIIDLRIATVIVPLEDIARALTQQLRKILHGG